MSRVSLSSDVLSTPSAGEDSTPTLTIQKILYDRRSAAFAISVSVRALDSLRANRQLNATHLGKKIMYTHLELVRFSHSNHACLTQHAAADRFVNIAKPPNHPTTPNASPSL